MKVRKRSRFALEWQRRAGSKQVAELVIFSGRWDAELLCQAVSTGGARQPAQGEVDGAAAAQHRRVKVAAIEAKYNLRRGRYLARVAAKGAILNPRECELLEQFVRGELRKMANDAVIAHGHGRLRAADGSFLDIGGSTGGIVRKLLDSFAPPSPEKFFTE